MIGAAELRLDRPTHGVRTNLWAGWMSEFTEEIPGQLAAGINRLGDGRYELYTIYRLPPTAKYGEDINPLERLQTTGIAPDRLTVELCSLDPDGYYRVYTIGRAAAAGESTESESIPCGDYMFYVRPGEVLTTAEAFELFEYYYHHHAVPEGWHLRTQSEFTAPANPD